MKLLTVVSIAFMAIDIGRTIWRFYCRYRGIRGGPRCKRLPWV